MPAGEYREQVRAEERRRRCAATSPREAILRAAPLSGGPAVIAENVKGARLSGFRILAEPQACRFRPASCSTDSERGNRRRGNRGAGVGIEIRGGASSGAARQRHPRLPAEGRADLGPSAPWISHNAFAQQGRGLAARDGARPALVGNVFEKNARGAAAARSRMDDRAAQHNFFLDAGRAGHGAPRRRGRKKQ